MPPCQQLIGNSRRIAVLTPSWPPADAIIAEFTPEQIMRGFEAVDTPQVQALVHVGTNLPVSALTPAIETRFGKPLIVVNVVTY